jgi:hypothetical protein
MTFRCRLQDPAKRPMLLPPPKVPGSVKSVKSVIFFFSPQSSPPLFPLHLYIEK